MPHLGNLPGMPPASMGAKHMSATDFLAGGGAMGARIRARDWSASSIGPPEAWPQSLRTALSIMAHSGFPAYLA